MAELTITSPDGRTRTVILEGASLSMGRASDNKLAFPEDDSLSRHHLVFEPVGGEWHVTDLGSKNGTFVGGVRLTEPHTLHPGQTIAAGRVVIVYCAGEAPPQDRTVFFERPTSPVRFTASTDLASVLSGQSIVFQKKGDATSALLRAGRELAARRPLAELFPVILDLAMEAVGGERGVLLAFEQDQLKVQASRGGDAFHISTAIRDKVIDQRASLLVHDTSQEESLRERMSIVAQQVRAFMAVPLQTEKEVFGLIYIDASELTRSFKAADLELLTVLSNTAAIRIERERLAEVEQAERLHAAELDQAGDIQRRFLPLRPPQIEGLDLAGFNVPCRGVGGDYYDFLSCGPGKLAMALGDVAGKGMPAALMMMNLQARVQALAELGFGPAEMVTRLNRGLAANCPGNRFITFFLGILDITSGEFTYVNAGHNPALLVRAGGKIELLKEGGPVLGILPSMTYRESSVALEAGDLIVMYSDGVSEAEDDAELDFGEDRLAQTIAAQGGAPAEAVITAVREAVHQWTSGRPLADDLTLLAARFLRQSSALYSI